MITQNSPGDHVPRVTSIASLNNAHPWTRTLQSKVPRISLRFWILTLVATTLGATVADSLTGDLELGLTATSAIVSLLVVSAVIWQLSTQRFHPGSYWLSIVLSATVGTLFADTLVGDAGASLWAVTAMSCAALAATFVGWHHLEHTVSVHSLLNRRREVCFWIAVITACTLGAAVQDLVSHALKVGNALAALLFAGVMVLAVLAGAGHKIHVVTAFWSAYVVTRPLGAALADVLTATPDHGGLGWGTNATSASLLALILVVSLFATGRRRSGAGKVIMPTVRP